MVRSNRMWSTVILRKCRRRRNEKKGKSNKKFMAILVAAIAVALVGMTIVSNSMGKKEIIPTVTTVKAQKGDLEEEAGYQRTVVSQNKKTFFSP